VSARATLPTPNGTAAHRPISGRLVIATHNPGKLVEMRELLALYGVEAVSAAELGLPEPDETGTTIHAAHQGAGRRTGCEHAGLCGRLGARGRCAQW
jgi:XTP/dITP diphosphohydrolase